MELEELLASEGIEGDGDAADTLAWARQRAEELVAGLVADHELGPLLDADFASSGANGAAADVPQVHARGTTEPTPVAEDSAAEVVGDVPEAMPLGAETASALADLPPPPERPDLPEVGPGVEAGPMADAAFDQGSVAKALPSEDEALLGVPPVDGAPASPDVVAADSVLSEGNGDDITQPRALVPSEPGVTNSGSIEIDDAEIEMLDDDDLELVEEDDDDDQAPDEAAAAPALEGAPPSDGPDTGEGGSVPEWQAALNSAAMGGGEDADRDSGLYRIKEGSVENALTDPEDGAAPPAPAPAPAAVEGDESMDIDLGDI